MGGGNILNALGGAELPITVCFFSSSGHIERENVVVCIAIVMG